MVGSSGGTENRDGRIEAALLVHVLMLHPRRLTEGELIVELAGGQRDGTDRSEVERAVRSLTEIGLLERCGGHVLPTPAAIRSYELWQG